MSSIERLNTVPIKPKEPTLVGEDPYNAEASVYAEKGRVSTVFSRGLSAMNFELSEAVKAEVMIPMDDPARMVITD